MKFIVLNFWISLLFTERAWPYELVVWNVGQGATASLILPGVCLHFDFGGEFLDIQTLLRYCKNSHNEIWVSHLDLDHISMIPLARQHLKKLCLVLPPRPIPQKKNYYFRNTPLCTKNNSIKGVPIQSFHPKLSSQKSENDLSAVFSIQQEILIPGDSPVNSEKIWTKLLSLKKTKLLLLGHHGSKTSTSLLLLNKLPQLKAAISSARKAKYGHPHYQVISRLKAKKIPQLNTEDWGNIHWFFSDP